MNQTQFATGSEDKLIKIVDFKKLYVLKTIQNTYPVHFLINIEKQNQILCAPKNITKDINVFDLNSGEISYVFD